MKSKIAIPNNPSSWLFNQKAERNQMNRQKSKSTMWRGKMLKQIALSVALVALVLSGCRTQNQENTHPLSKALMECSGSIASLGGTVCHNDYCVEAGDSDTACVDYNTGKFQIGNGTRITYKGQVIVQGPAEGNLYEIELGQPQIRNCPENEIGYYGGNNNTIGLNLGECFISGGTNNQYYMPSSSCLLKINEVQYSVVACDSGLSGSCLTDLGNGNRVVYVEPCFSE